MLRIARTAAIAMIARRTRTPWKAAALLLAGMALSAAGSAYAAAAANQDKDARTAQKARANYDKAVQAKHAAQEEKDVPDPVTRALKAAARNGSMSEERAIQIHSLLTDGLPGSNRKAKTETYLEQAAVKLDAMVTRGELSAEDADAKMIALEQQIAAKQELASRMEIDGKSKTETYLEQAAAKLDAMVATGELSAEDAEARLIAIENAVTVKPKAGSLDARTVLRAARRVDLNGDQKDEIRDIERAALGAYRKIPRKDKQGRAELAEQVKAEITKLLDAEQIAQFEAALKRLDRNSRRAAGNAARKP